MIGREARTFQATSVFTGFYPANITFSDDGEERTTVPKL
jgi:hypothetical protein